MNSGFFITLEGGEGTGKSTQHRRITAWLRERGRDVVETREPGGTAIAEQIRRILLDSRNAALDPKAELLLMFAARAQLLAEVIRPALTAGKVVLSDRFTDASFAYQGGGRKLGAKSVALLEQLVHADLQPDLTLLFDMPVRDGLTRVAGRGESDRFEREPLDFFSRVRQAYLDRARDDPDRFVIVDAGGDELEVWREVREALEKRMRS
ncbi:MAG: dTMP kinase [Lysobacterales bacterium]|jgi:dTMP kinase